MLKNLTFQNFIRGIISGILSCLWKDASLFLAGIVFGLVVVLPWSKSYTRGMWQRWVCVGISAVAYIVAACFVFGFVMDWPLVKDWTGLAIKPPLPLPIWAAGLASFAGASILSTSVFFLNIQNKSKVIFEVVLTGTLFGFLFGKFVFSGFLFFVLWQSAVAAALSRAVPQRKE